MQSVGKNMTRGNPLKLILALSLPLMVANAFQQLYTVADTAIVGSVLGALTYTALYLLKSYIKLRFTTADVDPAAIQVTMLSKATSSLFNAAFAFIVAPIFFNVLRKPLRRLGLYSKD